MFGKLFLVLFVLGIAFVFAASPQIFSKKQAGDSIIMIAQADANIRSKVSESRIEIAFRNSGNTPKKILNPFTDPKLTRAFFTVQFIDAEGTPFGPFGGGNVSLPEKSFKYIELSKDHEFRTTLDLGILIPSNFKMPEGSYEVIVTYFNRYGKDCFKGRVESRGNFVNVVSDDQD